MERYKNLWKWMIIPMVIMQLGIYGDYWGDFTDNPWSVHIHYWTGTIWYLYLIIQPYLATSGQMARHRTNGIIGMFLAGGVALTALSMMHGDITTIERAIEFPDRFGPFKPWFFYGVMAIEIPMILAFAYAVMQSIIKRKQLHDHAWWLISTVFIIMFPALGRGVQNVHILINIEQWPNIPVMPSIYFSTIIIIGLLLLSAKKFGQLKHPATFLAVGINLYVLILEPLGKSEFIQNLFNAIIK
ncbi:hypothetical protein [Winogradskyella sp. A3E31]|uniref:hypothetical protein n=1 Tax=Winogradskyella sp. A3E31 TaxID=3349637 RepID=UPI00398BBAAD